MTLKSKVAFEVSPNHTSRGKVSEAAIGELRKYTIVYISNIHGADMYAESCTSVCCVCERL